MRFMGELSTVFLVLVFVILLAQTAPAQQAGGVITGRVIADDGQPIPHAVVNISGVSGGSKQVTDRRETVADDDGNFAADGLPAILYSVLAWAPGYVPAAEVSAPNPLEQIEARFVRVGEQVTVRLIRGGVITGRVTNDAGEPVIGVPVKAMLVRDENGGKTSGPVNYAHLWTRTTDDRGVYRIYGLVPGSYIIAAGGRDASTSRPTPFTGRATTYHPSSTRDAATLVNVSSGVVATDIDIRYRGERGFAISGQIQGVPASGITQTVTSIYLRSPTTGETIETTYSQSSNNPNGYAFYGISNGEYEIIARGYGVEGENSLDSAPRRVMVKGADVTGVDLALVPNATISGAIIIMKADVEVSKCQNHRESTLEEILVRARRDDPAGKREPLLPDSSGYGLGIPYNKGMFTIRNLKSGRHRIEIQLPDETWYLKAMDMPGSKPAVDPRDGLAVKSGEQLTGLRLTIASGAATLKGKITVAENTKLPAQVHVHLIPAEVEAIEDILRFAETSVEADGTFMFKNLAPGKYFVLARAIPSTESDDRSPQRPSAWEPTERKKLRKEAEAANLSIELKPCQQITGYALRLTK